MKTIRFTAPFTILLLFLSCSQKKTPDQQTVNAVIGDASYIKTFDEAPSQKTDEILRIKTHLKYVEQLLREKDVSHLPNNQQKNREYLLDLLEQYRLAGQFPKNLKYSNKRVPCFIDKFGNICAVGYLIEQTAGREVAERINNQFQYEYLLA